MPDLLHIKRSGDLRSLPLVNDVNALGIDKFNITAKVIIFLKSNKTGRKNPLQPVFQSVFLQIRDATADAKRGGYG